MSVWLVSVPNEAGRSSETTFLQLKTETASTKHDYAECYRIELPDLLVGTLESLMALSDDLNRVDLAIESAVRKIERQFHDLSTGDEELTVDGVPVDRYLNHFAWDEAKHPHRRPLPDIVSSIQQSVGKVEEELKQLGQRYSEKTQQLGQFQRKKGGNLMVANLNEVLTPDVASSSDFVNTEYLQTLVVVVPKNLEETWLSTYTSIGEEIATYGHGRGSPVVPNSTQKLYEEGDACLYSVTLLKGSYQPGYVTPNGDFENGTMIDYVEDFKTRAKEHKFIARDFTFDPKLHASNEEKAAGLQKEVNRLYSGLIRWCKAHFGEVFVAWMHIKMVRMFAESVLRYGLPVNFVVLLYRPHKGKDKKLRSVLEKKYGHLQPSQFAGIDDSSSNGPQTEYHPYVSNAFTPLTS